MDARFAEVHEDIAALRVDNKELRRDMTTLDHGLLRQGMATLDRDLRIEMSQLATREELHTELRAVRLEMREGFDKVDASFNSLQRLMIGGLLTFIFGLFVDRL